MILTEHLFHTDKTSDFQKARNFPHIWVGQRKRKEIQRERNWDWTCIHGKELWKWKGFHTVRNPIISLMRSAGTDFWSLKGEQSTQFAEGKVERDLHRSSGQCQMTVLSGFHLSTGVSAGWVLRPRFWRSDHGKRTVFGCMKPAWEGYSVVCHNLRSTRRSLGLSERQGALVLGYFIRRVVHHRSSSFSCTLRQRGTTYMSSRARCELFLLSWSPEKTVDCCCHWEFHNRAQVAAATS